METASTTAGRREWVGLAVLVLPVLLISITVTVLYFALPFLSADLKPSGSELLWIVDIYAFWLAGLLLVMGTLGDRIGRRRLLLLGAAVFGITSAAAAYAPSAEMLIVLRALQGAAAATLMPSTLALIRNMFHQSRQRRLAIAIWAAGFSGGSVLGPIVGGWMLERFWWGSVFLINVPIMVLLLVLGPILLPEYRDPRAGRLDVLSTALSLVAVLPIVYGVKDIAEQGLTPTAALAMAVGLAAGASFIWRQRALADPMLDLRLFAERAFGVSLITSTLAIFALMGLFYFIAQYLQLVLGLRPFVAGILTLPAAGMALVGSMLAVVVVRWIRPGFVIGGGMFVAGLGFAVLSQLEGEPGVRTLVIGLGLLGVGLGAVQAVASDLVIAVAPPERAGSASAVLEAGTELGAALGVAVLGSLGLLIYRSTFEVPADLPGEAAQTTRETLGGAVEVAAQLSGPAQGALLQAARTAFTEGMRVAALSGTAVLVATAILATIQLRRVSIEEKSPDQAMRDQRSST
ncbi:MFS transporter [Nonomuraea sp. NPDC050680]|uniref:MFS transporter n=1 Tax=Nonomuraea sp. NPDC050680 TaxID=3154630 RepID=UPI0033D9E0CB